MGPGDHPYERFGHAALVASEGERDVVYNFGAGDFDAPGFFLDFLRGRARFRVGRGGYEHAVRAYAAKDRDVFRQALLLPPDHARRLQGRLRDAAARLRYSYDHFDDNCTTRVRDLVDEGLDGRLRRATAGRPYGSTYRQQARRGFAGRLDLLIGGELVGRPFERRPDLWEAMYLPDVLREEIARLGFAGPIETLARRRAPSPWAGDAAAARKGLWAVGLGGAIALALAVRRGGQAQRAAFAAAGVLLLAPTAALWFAAWLSALPEIRANENLAVLLPTDVVLFLAPRIARPYARARLALLGGIGVLHVAGVLAQDNAAVVAFAAGLLAPLALRRPRRP